MLAPLIVQALTERGHQITVITDQRPANLLAEERREGAIVVRLPFQSALAGKPAQLRDIRATINRLYHAPGPDLIHIFAPTYADLFHHLASRLIVRPLIVTLHDQFPASYYRSEALIGRDLHAADVIVTCSGAVRDTLAYESPHLAQRALVIRNALPAPRSPCWDHPDRDRIAFVGRLVRQKGVDVLISAMSLLAPRFPRLTLDIIGSGVERAALERQAAAANLAGRIRFRGEFGRDDAIANMGTSLATIVPSRFEPFGLVALEAAQAGRPVIASAVGGLTEVVEDRITGLLVPPENPGALAEAIASLARRPEAATRLGEAARRRAARAFSWDHFVDAYDILYHRWGARS